MTSPDSRLRALRPDDAPAVVALRREALETKPFAFGATVADDKGLQLDSVRVVLADPDQAIFGGFEGGVLVGMAGLRREAGAKRNHRCSVWGVYVTPRARRRGIARALLVAAIEHARGWAGVEQVNLGVTPEAEGARRMYASLGFTEWGRAPRAHRWEGRYVDMIHMALELGSSEQRGGA